MVAVTTRAREKRAVTITYCTTPRASLAGIVGVNKGCGDTPLQSLILYKLLELRERPGLMDISLLFSNPCAFPDMFKVFHNKDIAGTTSFYYSLANNVVKVADYSTLSTRKLFQEPLSSFSAFGLKRSPQIRKMPPYVHSLLARESEPIRGGSDVIDTKVYPNRVRTLRSRDWFRKDDIDVKTLLPLGFTIDQSSRGRLLPFKEMPLVVAKNKRNFNSALNSRKRHCFFGRNIAKYPLVVSHRGGLKFPDLAKFAFRGFSYSSDSPYCQIGSQAKSISDFMVAKVLKFNLIGCLILPGYLQHIVTGISEALKGSSKSFSLLWGGIEFTATSLNQFHSSVSYITYKELCQERREAPIPPATEAVGFLGGIL
jgi:hypothetical protein